jgi:selenocysteine lyase/cysteine desulfurase
MTNEHKPVPNLMFPKSGFHGDASPAGGSRADHAAADLELHPWRWWRNQMPIASRFAYLDHAAVGPITAPASDWIRRYSDQASQLGDTVWPTWNQNLRQLRRGAAAMVGGDPRDFFIVPNTTTGINTVADGWDWKPGDSVVIPDGEFPSNLFPWLNQRSKGVEVRIVPRRGGREVNVDDLMEHVDESTRIISVSWVGFATGFRIDLDQLVDRAHQRGVPVFVDAIQGLGVYPLDLQKTPVDFLAADGHKWLLGPEGVGIAMIRRQHFDRVRAMNVGWASVKNSHNYNEPELTLCDDATRFESGSANMVGIGALAASVELFRTIQSQHGNDAISNQVLCLANLMRRKLTDAGAETFLDDPIENQSGIVNFQVPGVDPAEFRQRALAHDVVLSVRGTGVRAAVHAYNNEEDIDRLVALIS